MDGSRVRSGRSVDVIRWTDALPVLEHLRGIGAPTEKLLCRAGLPESIDDFRDGFIPFRTILNFIGVSSRDLGISDLCWRSVQQAPMEQLGGWGTAVARCANLRSAMLGFCENFFRDAPLMRLGLEFGDDYVWFWRRRPGKVLGWEGDEQGQQYALAAMTRVVRAAAGPDWVPPRVQVESTTGACVAAVPDLAGCRVDLGRSVVAIAVPYELLERSTFWAGTDPSQTLQAGEALEAEGTLAGTLRQTLSSLMPAVNPSIEVAAEIAEMSPRSLRRFLAQEGTSFRRVADGARFEVCDRLLGDPERSLGEIAFVLGYSDPAHLTRAFRRWTGECPSAYRRRRR